MRTRLVRVETNIAALGLLLTSTWQLNQITRAPYVAAREAKMDWIIFMVAALQGLAISLGQASLKMNSMSFFQLTKQMQVPLVATIEYFWLGWGLLQLLNSVCVNRSVLCKPFRV